MVAELLDLPPPWHSSAAGDKPSTVPEGARDERLQELFDISLNVDREHLPARLKAAVLVIYWDPKLDDLNLEGEITALGDVWRGSYGYKVTPLPLDWEQGKPKDKLDAALDKFLQETEREQCRTAIVYYGGHATRGRLDQLYLAASATKELESETQSVEWEPVEEKLKNANLDVLVILDCCYAGSRVDRRFRRGEPAGTGDVVPPERRKFELICAAEASKETLGRSNDTMITFSEALTEALKQLSTASIFTTSQLLQMIVSIPKFPDNQFPSQWKDMERSDITLGPLLALDADGGGVEAVEAAKDTHFDLRFHFANRPSESQLQSLVQRLKSMSEEGVFTAKKIEWKGFGTAKDGPKDLNSVDSIDFQLFDSVTASATLYSEGSDQSDDWIDTIEQAVHPKIQKHSGASLYEEEEEEEKDRVKIAIIDTGYDAEHPLFRLPPQRVREHQTWVYPADNNPLEQDRIYELSRSDRDTAGHGTHGTYVLRIMAPDADIYVAKVTDGSKYRTNMSMGVSQAILHAYNEWDVDIISMSLGFPYLTEDLRQAIEETKDHVLLFAAASNDGANRTIPIAFPARAPGVFCVHSTDSMGNPSKFTPYAQDYVDNFATLGENVRSAWPKALRKGLEQRRSGTSTATPIAAGIAALLLEFGRTGLSEDERRLLKSHAGMREVLLEMASKAGDYWYLNPAEFFEGRYTAKGAVEMPLERIKAALERVKQGTSKAKPPSRSAQ